MTDPGNKSHWRANYLWVALIATLCATSGCELLNQNSNCGQGGREEIGVRYDRPTFPPMISEEQAIQNALPYSGSSPGSEPPLVHAQYVLFSDGALFKSVPAWVITFCGVSLPSSGGGAANPKQEPRAITYNHEMNVVIDAQTGKVLESFTYR